MTARRPRSPDRTHLSRARQRASWGILAAVLLAATLHWTGVLQPLGHALTDARFRTFERRAGGGVAIVEVDSESIRRLGPWPWSRAVHAAAIDRLGELGAESIGVDIDFSSPSTPDGDAALEAALARAGGRIALAAFEAGGTRGLVAPLGRFAANAWPACVDVRPDSDGRVRSFLLARSTAEGPCVTMPVVLAGGSAEEGASFAIDFSIDPASIERVSLADLIEGKVSPDRIRGRKVVLGATAVELRDFFLVPAHGVVAGPVLQALALETLLADRALSPAPPSVPLSGLVLLAILGMAAARLPLRAFLALCLGAAVSVEVAATLLQTAGHLVVDTAPWHAAIILAAAVMVVRAVDVGRLLLALSRARTREVSAMLDRVIRENFAGIIVADRAGRVRTSSREATRILGMSEGAGLTGRDLASSLPPPLAEAVESALLAYARGEPIAREPLEVDCSPDTSSPRFLEYVLTIADRPRESDPAEPGLAICLMFRDVTDRRLAQERMKRLARSDSLTGIPNRNVFFDELQARLADPLSSGPGIVLLDLDGFKSVNDRFGHGVGDDLLRAVALRLSGIAGDRCFARLGGDEFAIVVPDGQSGVEHALSDLARDIIATIREAFRVGPYEIAVDVSVGLAAREVGENAGDLMRKADAALYQAKLGGGGEARFYDAELDAKLREKAALRDELQHALSRGEIRLVYQPQVDLASRNLVGAEALARWVSPTRGPVSPATFIPLAEETGLIVEIGAHVLREACREAAAWPADLKVAVNVSSIQFERSDLAGLVEAVLAETGLAPTRLCLEITESLFIGDASSAVAATLARLRALGIEIALDDFGTGFSSLGYINRFPIDKIKIDQSFVRGLPLDAEAAAIVRAIAAMGESLHISVVAEGIETAEQASLLRLIGCKEGQGYGFGKPQDARELRARFPGARMVALA